MRYIDTRHAHTLKLSEADHRHVESKLLPRAFDVRKPVMMSQSKRAGSRIRKPNPRHVNVELFLMEW
jgi:hypothetical protein